MFDKVLPLGQGNAAQFSAGLAMLGMLGLSAHAAKMCLARCTPKGGGNSALFLAGQESLANLVGQGSTTTERELALHARTAWVLGNG